MNPASLPDSKVTLRARFRSATREAILESAAELLGADDALQTRMEDIAAKAGVAVGTVYNYFTDRQALVSALLESRTHSLLAELESIVDASQVKRRTTLAPQAVEPAIGFRADLTAFVTALGRHFEANKFLLGVMRDEEKNRGIDARSATRRSTVLGELLGKAERLMEKGIKAKVLRREEPALYAAMLVGMMRGVGLGALSERHDFSRGVVDSIVRLFMTGAAR